MFRADKAPIHHVGLTIFIVVITKTCGVEIPRVRYRMGTPMYFIFMLTHSDKTVPNCLEVLQEVLPLGLQHIGFKDMGVPNEVLAELNQTIRGAGFATLIISKQQQSARHSCSARIRHPSIMLDSQYLLW